MFGRPTCGERIANPTPVSEIHPNQLEKGRPNKMKLFSIRNLAMTGALSVAGLGLVGMGAHAVFTAQTTSSQQFTTGGMNVTLSTTGAGAVGNNTNALTLAPVGPTGSSFTTGDQVVTITNNSNIPVNITSVATSSTYATSALATELYICEVDPWGYVDYNGPLSGATSVPYGPGNPIAPLGTEPTIMNVYAGNETTACGAVTHVGYQAVAGISTAPSLSNGAEGQSITVTVTVGYSA
jgi:predicted ribosomally synthesized peptide with SipW-like signal peptide